MIASFTPVMVSRVQAFSPERVHAMFCSSGVAGESLS